MTRTNRDEKAYVCPKCGESVSEDARMHQCPTCGAEGYDECCFPAGSFTLCLDCETRMITPSEEID